MEQSYLRRVREVAEGNENIFDIGCGISEPIARYFIEHGYEVTGVDFAEDMLQIARSRYPQMGWVDSDMRDLDLDREFDIVIAWESFFLLYFEVMRGGGPLVTRDIAVRSGSTLLVQARSSVQHWARE